MVTGDIVVMPMTQAELDTRLSLVRWPAPVIHAGKDFPIADWYGFHNPYPNYYRGARVLFDYGIHDDCYVEEIPGSNVKPI